MKFILFLLVLIFSVNTYASKEDNDNRQLVKRCETLEARNQKIINLQQPVSLCAVNLTEARDSIAFACTNIAIGTFYQAKQALIQSITFLNEAIDDRCDERALIIPLRNDVVKFKNSL